ncbi:MAG TPA: ABC transporter permease subunit, partial [Polyangiaceae bacterium]|nr:ABC transporter permease subunit [Polyangiaceae bacterium]
MTAAAAAPKGASLWSDAWRRLRKNRLAVVSGVFILVLAVFCIVWPELSDFRYDKADIALGATSPSWTHPLGTDDLGPCFKYPNRTVNVIIAISLPVSMQLGVLALLFALSLGVPLGIYAAARHNTARDHAAMAIAMTGVSVPRFVLAPLLILLFSLTLYLLP